MFMIVEIQSDVKDSLHLAGFWIQFSFLVILIKNWFITLVISLLSLIIRSFSTKAIFQEVLLSVMFLMFRLLQCCFFVFRKRLTHKIF